MLKHSITHIYAADHPALLKCLTKLSENQHLFNGQKIATIVNGHDRAFDLSWSILDKMGYTILPVANTPTREAGAFFEHALPAFKARADSGLIFYNHTKGISHHPDSEKGKASDAWTNVLYKYCLSKELLKKLVSPKYKIFGTCLYDKPNGFLEDNYNERFMFVGTFFWVNADCFKNAPAQAKSRYHLEAFPGTQYTLDQVFNYGPKIDSVFDPYKLDTWRNK